VLLPIARAKQADLYLPSREISDTLLHRMASDAVKDGRPLVVFTLSDCDPAGHQMPVSIARKLQSLRDLLFPKFRFEVVPVALTVDQVRELGLPSTPLKETEKRADRWREAFGVEQTEIDALATLQPGYERVPQLKGGDVATNYTNKVPVVAAHDQTTTGKSVSINGGQYGQRQTEVKDPPAGEG
jgi:hypothetical protein